ncbi:MAG: transporter substrate-binding domain-containing protein [Candidatus Promineifilaceae bacterium]|nr:transporter substrate-binding domain-containing protein [Candidatus Promineifilaceae bacterium]
MSERTYNIILVILIIVACIVTGALLYLIYSTTIAPDPTPTPTPEPTTPVLPEDAWARIQASGKMVVGTSADYPPFAYWTPEYQLSGFDIELIGEIGKVLGVQVEIKDMAFDGLNWAMELGQTDVSIAALSITPERSASIDFSDVYFVSEDAILAQANAAIPPVTRVTELAVYRIGVQRTSVYSNWIHETLVDTGLMPASQLHEYEEIELAVRDLREGRLDVVILDFPVAQIAISQGGVKLVGQGLNTQYYGIGIPKGEEVLRNQLNNALRQLYDNGKLGELTMKYMGVAPPIPTPVPTPDPGQPTATPIATATPAPCVDGMRFVMDLNLDDDNMKNPPVVPPSQAFKKGWRIQNTGTCTWNSGYRLTYDGGNSAASSMGGQPTAIVGTVAPGAQYDIWVDLVAPAVPGVYQGFWVLRNTQDQKFGDRIWVGIQVPKPPTVTPPPTQTPSPGISFTVDRNRIFAGECVTFSWVVTGSQAVYFYPEGQPWQQNPVPSQGSRVECPPLTTVYNLRVVKLDNSVEVRQITIFVEQVPGAPVIERFTVDPPNQITVGECVDIIWAVTGNVSRVSLFRNNTDLWRGGAPISGTLQDCPPSTGQFIYIIEATGPGGTSRLQRTINVTALPTMPATFTPVPPEATNTPTPTPATPTPVPPVIYSFSAEPEQIEAGECLNVIWQVGGDASNIDLLRNGAVIVPNAPFSGSIQDCINNAGSYTYRLEVLGRNGQTIREERTVTVTETPSGPPLEGTNWFLQSYYDGVGAVVGVVPGSTINAIFDASGQLNGNSGCNTYSSTYTADDTSITIGQVAGTQQLCGEPPGVMEQESAYWSVLPLATSYDISSNILRIRDATGRVILEYMSRER